MISVADYVELMKSLKLASATIASQTNSLNELSSRLYHLDKVRRDAIIHFMNRIRDEEVLAGDEMQSLNRIYDEELRWFDTHPFGLKR